MKRADNSRFDAQRAEWKTKGITAGSDLSDVGLSVRALGCAWNCEGAPGNVLALAARTRNAVVRMRNVGSVTLAELDALLAFCGLSWAPEPSKESR